MKLCQELGGAKLVENANFFGVDHYSTVLKTIGRMNQLISDDLYLALSFKVLSQYLTP
ncbi:MAG: hypothetical protein ACJAUP_000807 [Cellvibrionaceae bacterium]|jgi:hypothetical protein